MMSFKKGHANSKKTFTLTEIVMVLLIVGILSFVATTQFNVYYNVKLEGAAKKLISDIRYIQTVAVSMHTDTSIVFNTSTDTYQAYYYDSGTSSWLTVKDPFSNYDLAVNFVTDPQYTGIDINIANFAGFSTLQFNWRGFPQDSSGTDLTVTGLVVLRYKGNTVTINISPKTGKATAA